VLGICKNIVFFEKYCFGFLLKKHNFIEEHGIEHDGKQGI